MRHVFSLFFLLNVVALVSPSCGNDNSNTPSDTDSDSDSDTDTDTDMDTDSDSDSDSDTDTDTETCYDDVFPPSVGPDGCARILLTRGPDGIALEDFSTASNAISRDGSYAAFSISFYDAGEMEDGIWGVDLDTMEYELISVSDSGEPGNGNSVNPSISQNGRFVAFESSSDNLHDQVGVDNQIYLRDRLEQKTELISISTEGVLASNYCKDPIISADGRYVGFLSKAPNLVPGDTNVDYDLFLRDRVAGTTERLNVTESGDQVPGQSSFLPIYGISDDGRYVLFVSYYKLSPEDDDVENEDETTGKRDVYLRDRETGKNLMPMIAPDGYHGRGAVLSLSHKGDQVLYTGYGWSHFLETDDEDQSTQAFIAHRSGEEFSYEPVYHHKGDWFFVTWGMSWDNRFFTTYCTDDFVEYLAEVHTSNGCGPVTSACVLDRDSGDVIHVTASEDGTPAIYPGYDQFNDYIDLSMSGDGKRMVFSTVLYGIVDDPGIPDWNTPHHIYLRDCP